MPANWREAFFGGHESLLPSHSRYDLTDRSMFAILGILIVVGSVFGGYLMHGGHMEVLIQPSEFLII